MLSQVCAEIRNYFTFKDDRIFGDFAIKDGVITPSIDIVTDYIRIVGSHKNDGVHKRGEDGFGLVDEDEFHGAIWIMSPPADFLAVVAEIEAWQEKYGGVDSENMSPYQSESFGGYSYSKSTGGSGTVGSSTVPTWQSVYASSLKPWRRIRVI